MSSWLYFVSSFGGVALCVVSDNFVHGNGESFTYVPGKHGIGGLPISLIQYEVPIYRPQFKVKGCIR